MWILLIPAILAALILFRWARTLVSVLIVGIVVWFCLIAAAMVGPGRAQMSPVVQCRIASYIEVMPDFVCAALTKGARKLTGRTNSVPACYNETLRYVHPTGDQALPFLRRACWDINIAIAADAVRWALTHPE